jgi:putative endonuclease
VTAYAIPAGSSLARDGHTLLGRSGEAAAAAYLRRKLYTIVETNYRTRYGEIDIIVRRGSITAFVEVKTRREETFGKPFEAVGPRKQEQLRRMASAWLALHHTDPVVREATFRFDVVSIVMDEAGRISELQHMKDAFR